MLLAGASTVGAGVAKAIGANKREKAAAAEAAVGLAIIVVYFKNKGSIEVEQINSMKG